MKANNDIIRICLTTEYLEGRSEIPKTQFLLLLWMGIVGGSNVMSYYYYYCYS